MEVTYELVQKILKTLPTGFYLKRDIPISLEKGCYSAYYNPVEGRITLGYEMIYGIIKTITVDNDKLEDCIRNLLYHEISHVLLTPKGMGMTEILNIFEDERIETILRKYYLRTNFKEFVKIVNCYKGDKPRNAKEEFYQTVRYRVGEKCFVDRVQEIIKKYATLNSRSTSSYEDCSAVYDYVREVKQLYNDIVAKWAKEPTTDRFEDDDSDEPSKKKMIDPSGDSSESDVDNTDEIDGPVEDADSDDNEESSDDSSDDDESDEDDELDDDEDIDDIDEPIDAGETDEESPKKAKRFVGEDEDVDGSGAIDDLVSKASKSLFGQLEDRELLVELKQIIFQNSGKKQNAGRGLVGYNGCIQPRLVMRDDYKWFLKKNEMGSYKRFKDTRLNLFIDTSGSFSPNEQTVNRIIKALIEIEKSRDDFELKVVSMGDKNEKLPDNDRAIRCDGGNYLLHDIYPIYNGLQDKSKSCYNIVLFDGDAQSFDGWPRSKRLKALEENPHAFGAFNHPNTTIISDESNEERIRLQSPRSKNIFTSEYAKELQKAILKMLGILMRG